MYETIVHTISPNNVFQDGDRGVVEANKSMALLLVEVVSPDVMYNGWPWPDEDFTKVLTFLEISFLFKS